MSALDLYRLDRRSLQLPRYERQDLGTVIRHVPRDPGIDGIVLFADLPESDVDGEIRRQVDYFGSQGLGFEWKVYGADHPADLHQRLEAAGFVPGDQEFLLVHDLGRPAAHDELTGGDFEIRELDDPSQLAQIVPLQEQIWSRTFDWLESHLRAMWSYTTFYVAYAGTDPIGSAYIEFPAGSEFAELHGGGVLPAYRGRGIYSRLFDARMHEARRRGIPFVAADAAPMSCPILQKKGFDTLDFSYPMVWTHR